MTPGVMKTLFNWLVTNTLEELASSGHLGRGARATGTQEGVSRVALAHCAVRPGPRTEGRRTLLRSGQGDTHRSNTRNMKLEDS